MNMNHVSQYNYNTSGVNNTQRFEDLNESEMKDPFTIL